jgi:hypothetical protein
MSRWRARPVSASGGPVAWWFVISRVYPAFRPKIRRLEVELPDTIHDVSEIMQAGSAPSSFDPICNFDTAKPAMLRGFTRDSCLFAPGVAGEQGAVWRWRRGFVTSPRACLARKG